MSSETNLKSPAPSFLPGCPQYRNISISPSFNISDSPGLIPTTSAVALTANISEQLQLLAMREVSWRQAMMRLGAPMHINVPEALHTTHGYGMIPTSSPVPLSLPVLLRDGSYEPFRHGLMRGREPPILDNGVAIFSPQEVNHSSASVVRETGSAAPIPAFAPATNEEPGVKSTSAATRLPELNFQSRLKCTFPEKIYSMLEAVDDQGQTDVISFVADGSAFMIHNPTAFETDVLPLYFSSKRMSSFQRQLNMYGFKRVEKGPWRGAYSHQSFIKGKKHLLENVKRMPKTTAND